MKWSIVFLLVLGVVAAVCAGLLALSLTSGGKPQEVTQVSTTTEVPYLVAARDVEPLSLISADDVEVRTGLPASLPEGAVMQPSHVIGKVLSAKLETGKPFTQGMLALADSGGVRVDDLLRTGMRAVNLSLSDSAGIEGLLYPGCAVDVISSFKYRDDEGLGDQQFARTVLENVEVLAIGGLTVVKPEDPNSKRELVQQPRTTVTILVDAKQAEALHLARQVGTLTVALRNKGDTTTFTERGARLPDLSPIYQVAEQAARTRAQEKSSLAEQQRRQEQERFQLDMEKLRFEKESQERQQELDRLAYELKKRETVGKLEGTDDETWDILILRGDAQEVRKFGVPKVASK